MQYIFQVYEESFKQSAGVYRVSGTQTEQINIRCSRGAKGVIYVRQLLELSRVNCHIHSQFIKQFDLLMLKEEMMKASISRGVICNCPPPKNFAFCPL